MHIKGMIFSFLSFFSSNTTLSIIKQMKLHRLQVITELVILEYEFGFFCWVSLLGLSNHIPFFLVVVRVSKNKVGRNLGTYYVLLKAERFAETDPL